jgi:CheY-like chemotaxis protein
MAHASILIVDDEPLVRWSLASRLKEEGCRTLEAASQVAVP